jgi:multicomponent Na+:H+ antiporter subunit E
MTRRVRWPAVVWLTVVWVLLWGTFTPLTIVGGVVMGVVVTALFRVPAPAERLPLRPLRLLGLGGYLLYDLVVSGIGVSWEVLRHGPRSCGAIVAGPVLTSSQRVVTVMANALSLAPGAMALEIDHERGVWYVYALGPRDAAAVERARRRVLDLQRRVLAALGTPEELAEARRRMAALPNRGSG